MIGPGKGRDLAAGGAGGAGGGAEGEDEVLGAQDLVYYKRNIIYYILYIIYIIYM